MEGNNKSRGNRGFWSSRLAFIFAASGAAVGLGNVWKFPYIAGENGGGAFVLVYLVCIAVIGVPVMMSELLVGRRGRTSPDLCFENLAKKEGVSSNWKIAGSIGILASFLILTFYGVIGGWTVAYLIDAIINGFSSVTSVSVGESYDELLGSAGQLVLWQTVFMLFVVLVVARGLNQGIERAINLLMPMMLGLLLIMLCYSMTLPKFSDAFAFMFDFDFSKLNKDAILVALGHAFFTLSLGMASMVAYGSFLPNKVSILKVSLIVSLVDTLVALAAGLIVFAVVFSNGLDAASGPGLVFQTLPLAFGSMSTIGHIIGAMFFLLLLVAAWSSAISQLEPTVQYLESRYGISRKVSAYSAGFVVWLIGVLCALSFNIMAGFKPAAGMNLFDFLDYLTANILLPLTALLVAVFTGWIMSKKQTKHELSIGNSSYAIWRCLIRYVVPILILAVFLNNLF